MDQHRILVGDCIDMMRTLPDQSVHTCITSRSTAMSSVDLALRAAQPSRPCACLRRSFDLLLIPFLMSFFKFRLPSNLTPAHIHFYDLVISLLLLGRPAKLKRAS